MRNCRCLRVWVLASATLSLAGRGSEAQVCPPQPCETGWSATFGNPPVGGASTLLMEGESLYAGGNFRLSAASWPNFVIRWDGCTWHPVGDSQDSNFLIHTLWFAEQNGTRNLYAGGLMPGLGNVIKYDGSTWSGIGGQLNDEVFCLAGFNDQLYAGGHFTQSAGTTMRFIARWDGASWRQVGGNMSDPVNVLTVHDDGNGAALYAGGWFIRAGSVNANSVAKWNGTTWAALGSGLDNIVDCMTSFDDGSGEALYVGGRFTVAGGVSAHKVAKWHASTWSALGAGLRGESSFCVYALIGFKGALYAGGTFTQAGGQSIPYLARWTGSTWQEVDGGVNGAVILLASTEALPPLGPSLYVVGGGTRVGGTPGLPSRGLAQWTLCDSTVACSCPGDMDRDGAANGRDIPLFAECLTGGGVDCDCVDLDQNGWTDSVDVRQFIAAVLDGSTCP